MIGELKIGWLKYKVIEEDQSERLIDGGDLCYGKISYKDRAVYINKGFSDAEKASTLLHESIHAIDNFMSLDLNERTVTALADGLSMLFADNPDLLDQMRNLNN